MDQKRLIRSYPMNSHYRLKTGADLLKLANVVNEAARKTAQFGERSRPWVGA